jgi:hypothetical protein
MLRKILLAGLICLPAWAVEPIVVSSGEKQTAVVELYTSEGCSSCPPADRWLSRLVEIPQDEIDVLALAFHVDYWDYLGWKDLFARADYSERQRNLGANNRQRTIYTPEFFVNGMEVRGRKNILDKVQQINAREAPVELQLSVLRDQEDLVLDLHSPGQGKTIGQRHLRYLVYENNLSTEVKRGENSGRTLRHQQVVRYMSRPKSLQVKNRHRIAISPEWRSANLGVAVLVTSPNDQHYLQALHTPIASLFTRP